MAFEHFDKIAMLVENDVVRTSNEIESDCIAERVMIPAGTIMRIEFVCYNADSFYAKADINGKTIKVNISCSNFHNIEIIKSSKISSTED